MPSPPKQGESRKDFMGRCVPYLIKEEGKTPDQAKGQCHGMWKSSKKNAKKKWYDTMK